jgi:hypothetical protein
MTVNDSAKASDGFGVVSTPVPTESAPIVLCPISPADPLRRKANGQVHFPGGVTVVTPGEQRSDLHGRNHTIYLNGFGWMTQATAVQVAASLAGAVAEVKRQETREAGRR